MSFFNKIRGTYESIIQLGKSGPQLKNSSSVIEARNSADSDYANMVSANIKRGSGTPEASVTATVGAIYQDTTNGVLYVKQTGTGNTGWVVLPSSVVGSFGITIDGGGSVITTGVKGYVPVPYGMTITGLTILADQSGSIVVDVWKDTYANYPPTVADTIAGTEKPTLSSAIKNQDLTLTTWTTTVTSGDIIGFNVDSVTTVTRVTLLVFGTRT